MNKFLNIFICFLICVTLSGCVMAERRDYIWENVNYLFAQRLENCNRYNAPVKYYMTILPIPISKFQTRIIGKEDGNCIVRLYEAEPLAPFNKYKEYRISLEVAKELSQMLKTALKEPLYEEEQARILAQNFSRKYGIWCVDNDFAGRTRCIEESLTEPLFDAKNQEKFANIVKRLNNDYLLCQRNQDKASSIISKTPKLFDMPLEQRENLLCKPFVPYSNDPRFKTGYYKDKKVFLRCYCNDDKCYFTRKALDPIRRSDCSFRMSPQGVTDTYYWQETVNNILKEVKMYND